MNAARRLRSVAAVLAMVAVLFSQLAVSAYACAGGPAMARATAMEGMEGCDEMPASDRSALCDAHCQQGDRSLDKPAVSLQAAALPVGYPVQVIVRTDASDPAPQQLESLLERPTGPPLAVRHCRFRI